MTAASSIHLPVFGMQPVVLFGTEEQQRRMIPPILSGADTMCFAVTEPNAGLNTTKLTTRAERCDGGYLVNGEKVWISAAQVANKMMLLARTTPLAEVKRKTEGLSLFFTDLDRAQVEARVIHKMGRHAVDSNVLFISACGFPGRTGSARRARASGSSCTASTPSGSCSAPKPSGSAASRSAAPPATPPSGSSSTARSA